MPRGDGRGPDGNGPRTGRGLGLCSGYNQPGYLTEERRGFRNRSNGRGFRNRFYEDNTYRDDVNELRKDIQELKKLNEDLRKKIEEKEN